jgi:uncharacterized protein (DUF1501 family)
MTNYSATRRSLLTGAGSVFAWAYLPEFARAGGRDPRFIVIILRGALDGLSAVAPVGDPDYLALHGSLALSLGGDHPALPLDSFFALNPAMPALKRLYDQKQAAIVHAVASPYRDRSHFDGQDVLESGYPAPGFTRSGWLNRALAALPKGDRVGASKGLGIGPVTPLVLRGSAPVLGWRRRTCRMPPTISRPGSSISTRIVIRPWARRSLAALKSTGLPCARAWTTARRRRARATIRSLACVKPPRERRA